MTNVKEVALIFAAIVLIWELIWKSISLWYAARNRQIIWYLIILIVFSVGIFPIAYLLFFQKKDKAD